jgi:hypothetical protein
LIYINNIVDDGNSSIRLFADNTGLNKIIENPIDAAKHLKNDLQKFMKGQRPGWLLLIRPKQNA